VEQYHQMIESRILTESDRMELIQGEILQMSPVGRRHAACVDRLVELLVLQLASQAIVRVQNPIQLNNHSEPQPDLALLRRRPDFYAQGHPTPDDILLIIEVSDSSADYDREVKVPVYAQDGIFEVWLIDLNAQTLEVYREPSGKDYQVKQKFSRGQTVSPLSFPELSLTIEQIFSEA
jgi:Uma2 family endonuclease